MKKRIAAVVLGGALLAGCASVNTVQVGEHEVIVLKTVDLLNPSTTTILEDENGKLRVLNAGQGNSVLDQVGTPLAIVAGGVLVGQGMKQISPDANVSVNAVLPKPVAP